MTAEIVQLRDFQPPAVGVASLYLNAWLRVWSGLAMPTAIPLGIFIRGGDERS